MQDSVVECLVERKPTFLSKFFKLAAILLDVSIVLISIFILFFLTTYFAFVCALVGLGWFVTWLAFRYANVEYEYSYFEGDFTVDKIYNKSKRKRVKRFNFTKVERVVTAESQAFGEKPGDERKMLDCSDNDFETEDYIALVVEDSQAPFFVRFTPNEELLEILKRKYSRKFY